MADKSQDQHLVELGEILSKLVNKGQFTSSDAASFQKSITLMVRAEAPAPAPAPAPTLASDSLAADAVQDGFVPSDFIEPAISPISTTLRHRVYCPWIITFGNEDAGHPGCRAPGSHGFFSHDDTLDLPREALECPWWLEGRCTKTPGMCNFAHHLTGHGQVALKPRRLPRT